MDQKKFVGLTSLSKFLDKLKTIFASITHTHSNATETDAGYLSPDDKVKLDGIETGAQENQNAFSHIVIGSKRVSADTKQDTFTLVAGKNISFDADVNNDRITIISADAPEITIPDLAQNDSGAKDYVKNRTHWTEVIKNPIVSDMVVTATKDNDALDYALDIGLQDGKKYIVTFDSIDYPLTCCTEADGSLCIGNGTLYNNGTGGNGEPFCVYDLGETTVIGISKQGSHVIAIAEDLSVIHKLDNKYLNIDDEVSSESSNPVSSRAVERKITDLEDQIDELSVSSGVQSDWNESDETALDYVKNRPFYEEESIVEILPETTVSSGATDISIDFTIGETYTVIYDGMEYECLCYEHSITTNPAISSDGIFELHDNNGNLHIMSLQDENPHTISITWNGFTTKTIDEKYIPETIARMSYVDDCLLSKADVSHTHDDYISLNKHLTDITDLQRDIGNNAAALSNKLGKDEALSIYETKEDAQSKLEESKSYTDTSIANLVNSAPETLDTLGELATALEENEDVVEALNTAIAEKAEADHTHEVTDVNGLQELLENVGSSGVQPDYNQNDTTAADYIKNRPFYTGDIVETEITTITSSEWTLSEQFDEPRYVWAARRGLQLQSELDETSDVNVSLEFVVGDRYDIVVDGITHSFIAKESPNPEGGVVLGDFSKLLSLQITGQLPSEDFIIVTDTDKLTQIIVCNTSSTAPTELKIIHIEQEIKKLDEKYLPDMAIANADWEVSDSSSTSYIKNRPFYDAPETALMEVSTISGFTQFNESSLYVSTKALDFDLVGGDTYKVSYDGTVYTVICEQLDERVYSLGNQNYVKMETGGDLPFGIQVSEDMQMIVFITESIENSHEIGISSLAFTKKIDPKYIPAGVADWDVNDSSISGYIKNKPFGYFPETILLDIQTISGFSEMENSIYYVLNPFNIKFSEDVTYSVYFDGDTYDVTYQYDSESGIYYLGNVNYVNMQTGGDYPFAILVVPQSNNAMYLCTESIESEHEVGIVQAEFTKKIDLEFLPDDIGSVQPDWNQEDESAPDYIKNKPEVKTEFNEITFIDKKTGYGYVAFVYDGTFITSRKFESIEVTTMPDKTEYISGEPFDQTGMVITGTYSDGTTKVITDYTYPETVTDEFKVFCVDGATEVSIDIIVKSLVDFEYIANDDGTMTLTAWKETLNGEPSTIMEIPNDEKIIL